MARAKANDDPGPPDNVTHNGKAFSKSESILPDGNTLVEYTHPSGDGFPVAFVAENPQDARRLMRDWILENKS